MKKLAWIIVFVAIVLLPLGTVIAAEPGFSIRLNRDFGYGGMGNQIQGRFSIIVTDDLDFVRVTYMMDEVEMGTQTAAPFRFQFETDDYAPGLHEYWAIGELSDGTILESNRITGNVLTKEDANSGFGLILGIIFGTIAVAGILSAVITSALGKKVDQSSYFNEEHLPKGFNFRGGTICKKCGQPYAYHAFSGNFMTHKLDHCPHCGKWTFSQRITRDEMIEAVKNSQGTTGEIAEEIQVPLSEEEKLRKQLDESRFMND